MFDRNYKNPRIYSFNAAFEHEFAPNWAAYVDVTYNKGVHLTRFLNYNVHGSAAATSQPATRDTTTYTGANPFNPQLGDLFVTNSLGHGLYRGLTVGVRKRYAQKYQLEANYVLSKDEDDDSNERDPFTDRSFDFYNLSLDYGPSDRDIRHKFNFHTFAEMPWRVQRPFRVGGRAEVIPIVEMFNTFNNANNVNPLSTVALFNFDGFLRQGVGDPRQLQVAVKITF